MANVYSCRKLPVASFSLNAINGSEVAVDLLCFCHIYALLLEAVHLLTASLFCCTYQSLFFSGFLYLIF